MAIEDNLATTWEVIAQAVPDAPAILQGERARSWREFEARAARLAGGLAAAGVGPAGKVAIDCYNSIEYLETVFAAFKLRAVPVNVNYRYRSGEVAYLLEDSRASAVVYHEALRDRVEGAVTETGAKVALVEVADGSGAAVNAGAERVGYEELVASSPPAGRVRRSGEDEFVLYTGGTTGRPRGVVWSHAALRGMQRAGWASGLQVPDSPEALAEAVSGLRARGEEPVALIVSPLMHGTAIFNSMGAFALGGSVVLCTSRSLDADEVCRLVARHRIRQLSIVGDAFAKPLLAALDAATEAGRPYDLSSLRRITSVGVTWSAEVKRALLRHADVVLVDGVAASEGGGFASMETRRGDPIETARFRLGPNARLIDAAGRTIAPGSGEVGYLAVAGPLPKGYLNDPEKSARTWREIDGTRYVIPGDMATLEPDGTVVLLGRGSEVVNTGGEKVFVEEVEQVIAEHPAVADVLVVGVPDDRLGTRIAAVVQPEPNASLDERRVIDTVGKVLADHKRPRTVVFVDRVPRTPAGKADRPRARALVEAAEGSDGVNEDSVNDDKGARRG